MKFSEVLNKYLKELNCSSKKLSTESGLSESVISRYRSGERTPVKESEQMNKLTTALFNISHESREKKYTLDKITKDLNSTLPSDNEWKQKLIIKQQNSKLKNNSFHVSLQEEEIYKLLVEKYGYVKRQYKSKEYPFYCDFFIPSENLYIEYNGHWTHNKEPFINSEKQQNILNEWKNKKSKFYDNAIVTWTKRDVLKRETAEKNNLNWKEFFNMEQIKLFLNT